MDNFVGLMCAVTLLVALAGAIKISHSNDICYYNSNPRAHYRELESCAYDEMCPMSDVERDELRNYHKQLGNCPMKGRP